MECGLYVTRNPPSTGNVTPLIMAAESLSRYSTASTTSLTSTHGNRRHQTPPTVRLISRVRRPVRPVMVLMGGSQRSGVWPAHCAPLPPNEIVKFLVSAFGQMGWKISDCMLVLCQKLNILARSANLPEGLYIFVHIRQFFPVTGPLRRPLAPTAVHPPSCKC